MENATNPEAEVEATGAEAPTEAAEARARDEQGRFAKTAPGEEPEIALELPTEEETDEIDLDGEKLALPKSKAQKLREGMMRHADYTRKTQEVAEQRKQAEAALTRFQREQESYREEFEEHAAVHALAKYLEPYGTVDWNKAMDEDPVAAQKQFMEWQTLKQQLGERQQKLQQKQSERALNAQRETARRAEDGRQQLLAIQGWSPQLEGSLKAYAKAQGIEGVEKDDFALIPHHAKLLHKAYLYDQLVQKAQSRPQPEPKPVKTVGQGAKAGGGLSDDLSPEEWRRRRLQGKQP